MKHRRIVVARDAADAAQAAAGQRCPQRVFTETAPDGVERSVAFMFAGGGAQYPNMGLDLYRSEPVFRAAVDECLNIISTTLKSDVRSVLFPPAGAGGRGGRATGAAVAGPAGAADDPVRAGQAVDVLGPEPTAMIGHSMGEYTAAHLAGVFSLADALALVELRGRLFETLPEGGMLSVPMCRGRCSCR